MHNKHSGLLFFIYIVSTFTLSAQTKEEIRAEQRVLQREIKELSTNLSLVKNNTKTSLGQLKMIEDKIALRQSLINTISKDIKGLDGEITTYNIELEKHKKDLNGLKENYAQSLVEAYKKRNNYDYINFLFSSNSFNDAYKRLEYLKSYRKYRDAQVNDIKNTRNIIQTKIKSIASLKGNKNAALNNQNSQLGSLESDKTEKDLTIKQLKDQEGQLAVEITQRERKRDQLRGVLNKVIQREIAEAQRQEQERLAKIAAARIAEEERLAKETAQRIAIEQAERQKNAQLERERIERQRIAEAAAEAERQRKLTEERIANEKKDRDERQERERRETVLRLSREKADKERQADHDRQMKRMADRNRAIDEANARDLAKKKAEEEKAKQALVKIDKEKPKLSINNTPRETPAQLKHRVEQQVVAENRQTATNLGRQYNVLESSKENMTQSIDFEKNKGSLPWPATGYVSQPFGSYSLPGSRIKEYNPGIEITSNGDPGVRSVANGIVSVVINLEDGYTIIVRHGKYFTTYNHLANVNVSKGQNVQAGTRLGAMAVGDYGKLTMLFIVSDDKGNELNPASWLK